MLFAWLNLQRFLERFSTRRSSEGPSQRELDDFRERYPIDGRAYGVSCFWKGVVYVVLLICFWKIKGEGVSLEAIF